MDNNLKEIREIEGLTQTDIANFLHVSPSTYSHWESGDDIMPILRYNELANYFHVTIDYLMGNTPIKIVNINCNIDKQIVAENLKKFRKNRKLTQEQLAKSINSSQSSIHNYESGKSLITTSYALEFSKQYDYSIDKLLGRK